MQEPTFYILTALTEHPQHGYGIMQTVARLSGDRVTLRAGTLYAALDRLTTEGLLAVDREEALQGRLRRYYRLTGAGSAALRAEAARMHAAASMATARLRAHDGSAAAAEAGA
ncbi:PadR family transcriptional regulator [Dactylosporangium sp. NPDC050688]|uniref:PadR family transcriptional regulator n=1 Tax=Dactylosporangium sp. NPDC050688 TaxID=3157217 RepID=UPI0033F0D221